MTMLVPILAGIGALCMSNPRRRRKARRAKSRRRNPASVRDLTDNQFNIGPAQVTVLTWRNKNATAFVAVTARSPTGVRTWKGHSQGPSSGGFSKPQQALEHVFNQMTRDWPKTQGSTLIKQIAHIAAEYVGAPQYDWKTQTNPRRRGRGRRNPPYHAHVGPVYMRNGRRNPSGAREPYESEKGSALLRHFKLLKHQGKFGQSYGESGSTDGAHSLCNIYNDATAPNLYRTEADAKACKRVAMLCLRIRTNHYGSRIAETPNGRWYVGRNRRNPRRRNPIHEIHRGDRVTIRTPQGGTFTGKAYLLGPAGWVLGAGPHGSRVKIANANNIVSVSPARR